MIYQNENFGGEYELRCGVHNGYHARPHLHEYSEVLFVKTGTAEVSINGKTYYVKENHLIFISPNQVHSYNIDGATVYCAVFSNDLIPLFFKKSLVPTSVDFSDKLYLPEMLPRLNGAAPTLISGYLNLICHEVSEQSPIANDSNKDGILYQRVISYIANHYTENITLKSIAAHFGYNEKYLSSNLHTLTGINFRQLLAFYRVNHAKRLLDRNKDYTVSYVALQSGFSSINSFNRIFKDVTGTTPTKYRKK